MSWRRRTCHAKHTSTPPTTNTMIELTTPWKAMECRPRMPSGRPTRAPSPGDDDTAPHCGGQDPPRPGSSSTGSDRSARPRTKRRRAGRGPPSAYCAHFRPASPRWSRAATDVVRAPAVVVGERVPRDVADRADQCSDRGEPPLPAGRPRAWRESTPDRRGRQVDQRVAQHREPDRQHHEGAAMSTVTTPSGL